MEIYITKNGQQYGPYSETDVRSGIASGQFSSHDLGWYSGMTNWIPLSQILSLQSFPTPPVPIHSSGLATTSFIMAIAGMSFWLIILTISEGFSFDRIFDIGSLRFMVVLSLLFASVSLTGLVFGIIGTSKTIANKWMAIVGMIANTVILLLLIVLISRLTESISYLQNRILFNF